ncbi:MAG: hypothetical protein A2289_11765 [Deltaproteobacteria bacterium RIFOXYA12_FULL_58_15]|nr:MAG: hypothetical protein A2289_11765 [Deltaproteobacteria bacterium RIFOXYA12_FULL_58_15]OGR11145.1 MAG: hypothetical protein A2341_12190 [Deltaproteobacteria bacterium RIFOXYB12_FULL_58_9]
MDSRYDLSNQLIIAITPFERPDAKLAAAAAHAGALAILDLGHDAVVAAEQLEALAAEIEVFGVRVANRQLFNDLKLPQAVRTIVIDGATAKTEDFDTDRDLLVQVTSLAEAKLAVDRGANGIIAKGNESGGRVGEETTFILLQRLVKEIDLPIWAQGGIGLHTAAGCIAGGARGVVLDSQLALMRESAVTADIRKVLERADGSETLVAAGHRILLQPELSKTEISNADGEEIIRRLGAPDSAQPLIPAGQDIGFAPTLAGRYPTIRALLGVLRHSIISHLRQAKGLEPFGKDSSFAKTYDLRYPVMQGPMTRVSDGAAFAGAVADGGGLPFVALSMMRGPDIDRLLAETKKRLGRRPWGVGILGFVPAVLRDEQLNAIIAAKPPAVLIGGGRPAQARALEQVGIPTFLHVPSPGLMEQFLHAGVKRFILEGRECGGHVGPRSSFVLWESLIELLLRYESPPELSVVFAGGIHDACSAAMVAAIGAPLAARGAKVGLLMGTAYLFTQEATDTGAIGEAFQNVAITCDGTTLLETAVGHATRCAKSSYVDTFHARREELQGDEKRTEDAIAALEELNLGRLRIAAKGVRREGDNLVRVDQETQRREGLFMLGQVAALRDRITTIEALHRDVCIGATEKLAEVSVPQEPEPQASPADIAIIGMAGVMPEAPDLDHFWANVLAAKSSITEVPKERWRSELYYDADAIDDTTKSISKWGAFLPDIEFDPIEFGIPPLSLSAIDPAQLLTLLVAKRALADAGYVDREFDRSRVSVIVGAEAGADLSSAYGFRALYPTYFGDLPKALDAVLPKLTEDSFPGVLANVIAGRVANRLDFGGVNCTTDAACASSLAALDLSCKELVTKSSDMVLCGGVDLHNGIGDYLMFSSVHALSARGQCRVFDSTADGTVLGEGVGVVVLKRLEDAVRDGDRIYAVIKAVAGASDGRSQGLTAPRKEGQIRALARAYQRAGVSPKQVGVLEAHGTGTVVGDRTELASLTDVFTSSGTAPSQCALGSVKSQIGHTKCAAGLISLIKMSLALYHRTLPPTLHVSTPNPAFDPDTSPFTFCSTPRPWIGSGRHAGVSAFGFGGANYHAVLSEAPQSQPPVCGSPVWPAELFAFRGETREEAMALAERLLALINNGNGFELRNLAHSTLRSGRGSPKLAIVAGSHDELQQRLTAAVAGNNDAGIAHSDNATRGKVAFLFPGQGSQRVRMLADLFIAFPHLHDLLELGSPYLATIFPPSVFGAQALAEQRADLTDTRIAQPALGIVDLAMARLLGTFGIKPDMTAGHSYGELVALCVAGVCDAKTLIALSEARGRAMAEAAGDTPGAMIALNAPATEVAEVVSGCDHVVVANYNAPDQTVIAGDESAVIAAADQIAAHGYTAQRLPVACAFHSPLVAGARKAFTADLANADLRAPDIEVWANSTAKPYERDPQAVRRTLAEQLVRPVKFVDEIEGMYAAGARLFVEVGPARKLTHLVGKILEGRPHTAILCNEPGQPGIPTLLGAVAELAVAGVDVDLEALFRDRGTKPFDLSAPPASRAAGVWLVNGQRAVPTRGNLPDTAMRIVTEPIAASASLDAPSPADNREVVVAQYLQDLRELVRGQREVMLSFLGTAPSQTLLTDNRVGVQPAPAPQAETATVTETAQLNIGTTLLNIVSKRTGYPVEMLDLDLDLEGDLSVDSIKRIEILGELSQVTGQEQDPKERDRLVEELAGVKTLRGILTWLEEKRQGDAVEAPRPTVSPQDDTAPPTRSVRPAVDRRHSESLTVPTEVQRYQLVIRELPNPGELPLGKRVFSITDDGHGVAAALASRLRRAGCGVKMHRAGDGWDGVDGLIHLGTLGHGPRAGVKELFALARTALVAGATTLLVATGLGGNFGRGKRRYRLDCAGVSGLVKAIAKEWPGVHVRVVDVDPSDTPVVLADLIWTELCADDDYVEVGYNSAGRQVLMPTRAAAGPHNGNISLGPESLVLATGGARGITATIAKGIAQRFGSRFVLVGRSPLPTEAETSDLRDAEGIDSVRRALAARSGNKQHPREIDKEARQVLAAREIRQTLCGLEEMGAKAEYRSLDVRNTTAFADLIGGVYDRYGRIDVVLHGAGIVEDQLIRHKSVESFDRVFDTKVQSALALADNLRPDVQAIVFFASISGVLGNRGQSDYAAANDYLDKLAINLNDRLQSRVVSIDWGPWAGVGMVDDSLSAEYEKRGMGLITPAAGVESLIQELTGGAPHDAQILLARANLENLK